MTYKDAEMKLYNIYLSYILAISFFSLIIIIIDQYKFNIQSINKCNPSDTEQQQQQQHKQINFIVIQCGW
ncbi:hypothetical protein DERF_002253 [Dermatophagoides farinae]|uniref:Uncharacterized protein n=1 Tax=Dermatophagoides farinae TaxID=6954 RepID=A0A922ICI4_DERFA|nr:hypothetical protein DERF_002253 [Dermatophagoides farinae]